MKQKLLSLMMVLLAILPASALYFEVDGFSYIGNEDGTTVGLVSAPYNANIIVPATVEYDGTTYTVTVIRANAFSERTSLLSVTLPNTITDIKSYAFQQCKGLTSMTIPNSVINIGESAFANCTGLTSLTLGESVTTIGDSAFDGCTGLTALTIPDSVTEIGNSAFYMCSGLTSLTIGNSVTTIDRNAFGFCKGLTEVTIPNSVTSIGHIAFGRCEGLTALTIGKSVTSIGALAFYQCDKLNTINSLNPVPPTCETDEFDPSGETDVFDSSIYGTALLSVPAGSVDAYKAADEWMNFQNMEELPLSGIQGVSISEKGQYYDLSGRKVNAPGRGIYIVDGKKTMLK